MDDDINSVQAKNKRIAVTVFVIVFGMIGASFAAVPLYDLFCRVTGFGGTTGVSDAAPATVLERKIKVRFTSDIATNLPWSFKPDQNSIDVNIGQNALVSYTASNIGASASSGTALYNVTPAKAGKYFHKIQCFCFERQTLEGRQKVNMPISFYIDPAIAEDKSMDDVKTITLSYTFYKADTPAYQKALANYDG